MEAMENAVASEYYQDEAKEELPACSCYNQVAGSNYYDKMNLRQLTFSDARSLFDKAGPHDIDKILEVAKRLETYYLEGKTLAETVE